MESWAAHPCRAAVPSWLGLPSLCPRLRRAEQWDLLCLPILRLPGKCSSPEGAPGTGLPCSDSREGSNSLINCQLGDSRVWAKMRDTSLSPQSSRAPPAEPQRERAGKGGERGVKRGVDAVTFAPLTHPAEVITLPTSPLWVTSPPLARLLHPSCPGEKGAP